MNVHYHGHDIRIYIFPAGVHHVTQYTRSLWPDTLFWVNAQPQKINTSQSYLGSAERSPAVYLLSTSGSGPIARSTPGRCAQGDSSTTSAWMALSGPATMLNWTSDKASADIAMPRPITILTWWLVRKGQRPTQNKYPKHSVLLDCGDEQRLKIM